MPTMLSFLLAERKRIFKHLMAGSVDVGANSLGCETSSYRYIYRTAKSW